MDLSYLEYEIAISAPASVVYRHLTERVGLLRWIAVDAVVDARPGGELRWTHENGATMIGRFIELRPPRRLVFRYGWQDELLGLPPESSTVEINLDRQCGRTILRLTHRGLPDASKSDHGQGWDHFLSRLVQLWAHRDNCTVMRRYGKQDVLSEGLSE